MHIGLRHKLRTWRQQRRALLECTNSGQLRGPWVARGERPCAVSPSAQGHGIGRMLVKHSLTETQAPGYIAMQFNYVVSKNAPAVQLYKELGFTVVGTLRKAFRHK
ncbi:GNAT family N-acetyltransferase [Xanthomonas arboricola]|uniref:GNAT family N-acetyltransferase n=2 Tax=Xanthomonas arboricola TaxID=56448 RepID=UPI002892F968|nr:GNAT family N-acetyltransferase [Xanthomonas arboricola]